MNVRKQNNRRFPAGGVSSFRRPVLKIGLTNQSNTPKLYEKSDCVNHNTPRNLKKRRERYEHLKNKGEN